MYTNNCKLLINRNYIIGGWVKATFGKCHADDLLNSV